MLEDTMPIDFGLWVSQLHAGDGERGDFVREVRLLLAIAPTHRPQVWDMCDEHARQARYLCGAWQLCRIGKKAREL